MNDHYSDAFKSIVPEAPSSARWAAGARRKRRTRGRVMAGVAAAAAVALVVPLSQTLGSNATLIATPGKSESPSPHVIGPSPDPATDAPGAAACWEAPGQPRTATAEGAEKGAVRAWLCGDAGIPESFPGAVGPMEPLVNAVDDIVDLIQMWEAFDYEVECTADGGTEYRIVLDYDDDSRRVVAGVLDGCDTIRDGEQSLPGARELYDRALNLWVRQRERVDSPDVVAVSQCRPPSRSVVPDHPPAMRPMLSLAPVDAVTGFTCVEDPAAEFQRSWSSILEPDVVALIGQSVVRDSEEGLAREHLPTWVTITGAWGEALTLQRTQDDAFQWFDGTTAMLWAPPDDILQRLEAAAQGPADVNSSPSPSQPVIENNDGVCMLDSEGRMTPTDLPDNILPDGPEAVWLCDGAGSPAEPLVGQEAMQRVVDTFRALPTSSDGGVYPAPNHAYVLVDYPGDERYVIEVDTNATFEVRWGAEGQHVRYGGGEWFSELTELWREQRNSTPQDPLLEPVGDICGDGDSSLRRTIDHHDEAGFMCSTNPETGEPRGASLEMGRELVHAIVQEAQADSNPWPDGGVLDWSGDDIVLVDDYGETLRMIHTVDDTWLWSDPSGQWEWSPSPSLEEQLSEVWPVGLPDGTPTPS